MRCPKCNGEVRKYGFAEKVVKSKKGEKSVVKLQRTQCLECGVVSRVYPDYILPYKQYERDIIEGVQEGLIDETVSGFEDYPCELTMKRWRGTQK